MILWTQYRQCDPVYNTRKTNVLAIQQNATACIDIKPVILPNPTGPMYQLPFGMGLKRGGDGLALEIVRQTRGQSRLEPREKGSKGETQKRNRNGNGGKTRRDGNKIFGVEA